jgi:hypothetical protein
VERCWERQESEQRILDCNKEQMEGEYNNGGRKKRKNPEDDYKDI